MSRNGRIVSYVLLGLLGAAVSVAGLLVLGGWFPGGALLALAGSVALFYGGTRLTGTRLGAGVPAAVWLLTVIYLGAGRPEGDAIVFSTLASFPYLLVGSLAGVMCATLPQLPPPVREQSPAPTG